MLHLPSHTGPVSQADAGAANQDIPWQILEADRVADMSQNLGNKKVTSRDR